MITIKLKLQGERDFDQIVMALQIAAEKFDGYTQTVALSKICDQFAQQAKDCRRLAEVVEEALHEAVLS